ncbi:translation initiation factor IF-2-like [Mustela putorius furo]|uniref:Translation initiation factor IF-2-like n=1 Tax=Mustela putorius furo TaxID=9669 RepID=A0A8U0UYX4_MUSPF|nr:translation initiation factor IF-2-like [Mustela putorius furo]
MTAPLQQSIASCQLFPAVSIALRAWLLAGTRHAPCPRLPRPARGSPSRTHTDTAPRPPHARPHPPRAPAPAPHARTRAPLPERRATSARPSPPARPAAPRRRAPRAPRSAAGLEPGFPCSPLAHSLLCSPPARGGTYSGDGHPQRPFRRFSRRLGVSAALGRKSAPRAGCASPDQGLGELVAPQAPGPLPHPCRLAGRTGCLAPRQPLPFSQPRPLLPLGCARGTPVLAAAKISHQQTARESGEPETGMDETSALP